MSNPLMIVSWYYYLQDFKCGQITFSYSRGRAYQFKKHSYSDYATHLQYLSEFITFQKMHLLKEDCSKVAFFKAEIQH